ncbi:TioE family transcriptional regulator [Nonomuraea wenchangensis]|uniref:TioE family transcriptional regulator n=1 Tax=Nonomuraea wenchangensis TaxID=568860 RepID=UPI003713ADBC
MSREGRRLRPVDLARGHGLSTQAVRNYEEAGILPPADRTAAGYRAYTPRHAQALRAFLALVPAHGHATATAIMRAVNEGAVEDALRRLDESHAQLLDDRRTLEAVERALADLAQPSGDEGGHGADLAQPSGGAGGHATSPAPPSAAPTSPPTGEHGTDATFIGPLARRLGLRPATLRKWERAGLVRPRRDPKTGYRVYSAADVRDARLAHQLRRGGYLLEQIAPLIEQVRAAGGVEPLRAALDGWRDRLSARGRAMLSAAAELNAYLSLPD